MNLQDTNNKLKFINSIVSSINQDTFVKLTLCKPAIDKEFKKISAQLIDLKGESVLKCTYTYKTQDKVKNFSLDEIENEMDNFLDNQFKQGILIEQEREQTLLISKKGKTTLLTKKSSIDHEIKNKSHDRQKKRLVNLEERYLQLLKITDEKKQLIPRMSDKYKQINKYLELFQTNIAQVDTSKKLKVVDMGAGKGYLTFALYHYLKETLNLEIEVIGVELREDLVTKCNSYATECGFTDLTFINKKIEEFKEGEIDILIALHACDIATDDAIAAGIKSDCQLIVCAPCCHKQIRREIEKSKNSNAITQYGIFLERSCEMITDTIRALILEDHGYKTKIFEFVSNEHTRKNIMLTALKDNKGSGKENKEEIKKLKTQYGIEEHYLEVLLK